MNTTERSPRIGIVSLGEAGNLGDDLILIAVIEAVFDALPGARISFLAHGRPLDLASLAERRGWPSQPHRIVDRPEVPFLHDNRTRYRDVDGIVFGGGGLFQTSHSADRPYSWLSYLPNGDRRPVTLAVGIGLGPIDDDWSTRLRELGSPFDEQWVRDEQSRSLAELELGWPAAVAHDFVDDTFLKSFDVHPTSSGSGQVLGVALRAWPGLTVEEVSRKLRTVHAEHGCTLIRFFVLESAGEGGTDVEFSQEVAEATGLPFELLPYRAAELPRFLAAMTTVDVAVSMKLHSSALWGAWGVPMYPIYYAPKIAAFFGTEYRGLEVSAELRTPPPSSPLHPRSADVIRDRLPPLLADPTRAEVGRFPERDRLRYKVRRLTSAAQRRLAGSAGRRRGHR